ncbi:histidine phosphatase family protein [Cellulomonas dongxiuzhuiae]|uniref:Histidine phosphatase family protein n=1 Tax=Cellulomonas dongxiuzhuiae TaxID=2819979 RepID=A0ABX8GL60_9CELL|nr:histidine phosphatase family protein [Cellulomonas dongxiuzhuiae]MBO3090075.1 histidine phosphatase family protein [Cellulomonas dongxiuzhuiae]MBO3095466.1 histidine phosphatase family protein [Cellulomonas dongxiuzhuiae]QWC16447.1 histidine phosphatase family protein [Cellulomonas dongxiuzhuiae]
MRLLLLRHGQTQSNVRGLVDTAIPGPGLTALGERQAAAVPAALEGRRIDAIAISTLLRTALTAAPLADRLNLAPTTYDGLREVDAGDLEMSSGHEAHQAYISTVFAWARGDTHRRMPGGPDGATFLARFDDAVAQVVSAGGSTAVVVSHGAAIRCWAAARVAGLDVDDVERTSLDNTGAIEIDGDPAGGWRLVAWSTDPLGGPTLRDDAGDDPTGEPLDA